jgi:hypothetical protein
MADVITKISKEAQTRLMDVFTKTFNYMSSNEWGLRERLLERDLAYYRENDYTEATVRARRANKSGDVSRLQNLTVPIVMPQVETQLADLANIFLTGYPLFGVVAPPDDMEAAAALEAQIADNAVRFGWQRQLMLAMRDGLKYNLQAAECTWEVKKVGSVLNKLSETGTMEAQGVQTDYAGNRIARWDLYNTVLDPRVEPAKMHEEGEFAGNSELISRTTLKRRMASFAQGTLINATDAFQSGLSSITNTPGVNQYYIPQINSNSLIDPGLHNHDWMTWLGMADSKIRYAPSYEWSVLYVRLIPSEMKVQVARAPNTPRIFKLIVINRSVLIYAQIVESAHDFLPVFFGQPVDDGLAYQTKSYAQNQEPFQALSSAMWTSVLEGQRRQVYDRLLYDPDRVRKEDINKADSVGRIAVRNKSYSKNVAEGVAALPYRNENQGNTQALLREISLMADESAGSNRAARGQFQKGNRTRTEYEDVMSGVVGRTRLMAISLEVQFFQPIKEVIKLNTLQNQSNADFMDFNTGELRPFNPQALRKARIRMKMSDGLLPSSKLMSGDLLTQISNTVLSVPALQAEYDVLAMLEYNWRMSGATWLPSFKRDASGQAAFLQNVKQMAAAAATEPALPGNPTQVPGVSNGTSPAQ